MPPAEVFSGDANKAGPTAEAAGMGAVFQDLNKGEGITAGLKKVDASMQTHKNPSLRSQRAPSPPEKKAAPPPPSKKPASLSVKKKSPPKKELHASKWIVENFENEHELVIEGDMNQSVFIDRCNNCTIQIKGKVNAVTISECRKVGVLVENLVSGVEIIKSSGFGLQATGVLPTLTIDQSHEGQIYLNKGSLDTEILTAQTSSLNVNIPKSVEGDYNEVPLPEQIVHKLNPNGTVTSTIMEHAD
jgi:adenylyl cyclase-associated protein